MQGRGVTLINITSGAEIHTADDWDLIMSEKKYRFTGAQNQQGGHVRSRW